jgi:cytochrome d ubiquinol oxidase subunit II
MFDLEFFQFAIYFVFITSVIAYATLDGFDLGVGCLYLFAKTDRDRRLMLNAIGPVWDKNTTWIVVGGGVLFAGFPKVFGCLMSGFYTPMMCLIFGFMLRGAAVEFRSKQPQKSWRRIWDISFFGASLLLAATFGLLLGNLIEGIPIDQKGYILGGVAEVVTPYPLLVMCFALSLFMMHGSIYLLMKLDGSFQNAIRKWVNILIGIFLVFWVLTTAATFHYNRHMINPILEKPVLMIFPLLSLFSIGLIPYTISRKWDGWAFIASCFSIVFLLALFAIGTFPYLAYSTLDPANSMTLFNSSVSKTALVVLTIVSLTGVPLSIFYGAYLYRTFRGKVRLDSQSY